MKTYFLFILTLFAGLFAVAQDSNWFNYTSGTEVTAIIEDNEIRWIATTGGLVKYNLTTGQSTFYNGSNSDIPHNYITSMARSSEGTLWLGTLYRGLVNFDGINWQAYNMANSSIPFNRVTKVVVDVNDVVWLVNDKYYNNPGLFRFDGETWTNFTTDNSGLPENYIIDMVADDDGTLILGTYGGGVATFDGSEWTVYDKQNSGLPGDFVMAVASDHNGKYWFGYADAGEMGLASFDGSNWLLYDYTNSPVPFDAVYSIATTTDGAVYMAVHNSNPKGVIYFDGLNWITYTTYNSDIIDNYIKMIEVLENGVVWIGTHKGLVSFNGAVWTAHNTSNSGIPYDNRLNSLSIENNGTIWIGSWDGLVTFDKTNWTVYNDQNSGIWANGVIHTVFDSEGTLWLELHNNPNYDNKLSSFDGTAFAVHDPPTAYYGDIGGSIAIDQDNKKWFRINAAMSGICSYWQNNWQKYDSASTGIDLGTVSKIVIDTSNTLWCGIWDVLVSYDVPEWNIHEIPNSGGANLTALAVDQNNVLWGSTYNQGLFRKDGDDWTLYDTDNSGLPCNLINDIQFDNQNTVWLATINGLASFDGINWEVYYKGNSGLPYNEVERIAIDDDNNKWIICKRAGLTVFNENGLWLSGTNPHPFNDITIFPNPVHDILKIELPLSFKGESLSIFNLQGKVLLNQNQPESNLLDVRFLPKGIYILEIRGSKTLTAKFLKQ